MDPTDTLIYNNSIENKNPINRWRMYEDYEEDVHCSQSPDEKVTKHIIMILMPETH